MANDDEDFFAVVLKEIKDQKKRAGEKTYLECKKELENNVYPILEMLLEAIQEKFDAQDEVIAESLDPTESVVHPELTERIVAVLGMGDRLAAIAEIMYGTFASQLDEITHKRITEQLLENKGSVTDWAAAFRAHVQALVAELDNITIEDSDDDDEEDDTEDMETEESDLNENIKDADLEE